MKNSYGSSNVSAQLFEKILRNCTCFPFTREKIISIFVYSNKLYIGAEARTFRFGFFKKYIFTNCMFSLFGQKKQYIQTNFSNCS